MQHWEVVNDGKTTVSNSAKDLWTNATKYFNWCDTNPIIVKQTLKSGKEAGKQVITENPRPYSIKGLCLHCGVLEEYVRELRQTKDKTSEYYIVISKILYLIYVQNQELATVGVFNPIFVSKVLNMDKDDTPVSNIRIEIVDGLPTLSKTESEVLEKIETENQLFITSKEQNI